MLHEYLTNTLRRLAEGGARPVAYPELVETARADIAAMLNEFYKEGVISVHSNVNGVKIIMWKGEGASYGEGS